MITAFMCLVLLFLTVIKIFQLLTKGRCKSSTCLIGKTALITGGNSGIGFQTALALAGRGCRIIIADKDDCEKSKQKIIEETGNSNIVIKNFNLASLKSVRALAEDINKTEDRLDILINNAGTGGLGNCETEDGLHIGMQVNHFGAFLLTHLLIGLLKKSAPSRIIFVSSMAAYFSNLTMKNLNPRADSPVTSVTEMAVYANSKLCNVITANELSKKLQGTGVTANSLHPGIVHTPIYEKSFKSTALSRKAGFLFYLCFLYPISKNVEEGAQTSIYLATAKEVQKTSGKYFMDCKSVIKPFLSKSSSLSKKIWQASEDLVKLAPAERL